MNRINFILFLMLILKPTDFQYFSWKDEWVVWNIGQGQWVTHILGDSCLHYDVGGEIFYAFELKPQIQKLCFHRQNKISVSHWDFDHYSLLTALVKWVPQVCWVDHPTWPSSEKKLVVTIQKLALPNCSENPRVTTWRPSSYKNTNESSGVYLDQSVLIPGDSPTKKEKQWISRFAHLNRVSALILGHHGSRTSTGDRLLKQLTKLNLAIASARFAKYHHPHRQTLQRLQKNKVPVLKTGDWGHIHWQD
jgi:competence protein ComEC